MTKEQMFQLMNENPHMQLATMDGDQPRVRGMMLFRADEQGIIFHTASSKEVYHQLLANPKVELCFFANGTQIRVTGLAKVEDDPKLREEIFAHPSRKFLQAWKDMNIDHLLTVFRVTNCKAVTWTMETNFDQKEPVTLCE